jgi:MATE family multidrug resistance protein
LSATLPDNIPVQPPSSSNRFRTELKALLNLGAPMVATQFFIMAMGFLDTAMAGRYDSINLAGVALGGMIMWPVFMLTGGFTMALTPIVAQLRGAGATADAGVKIRQGLWIGLIASFACIAVILNAGPVFTMVGVDPAAAAVAEGYLAAAAWGMPAVQVYVVLRYTSEGLGRTLPPMIIAGMALPVNGLLNYIFIYGKFGAPELGGVGCGWATAIVMWMELGLILFILRTRYFRATGLTQKFDWPHWREIKGILRIGVPIGLTVFLEMTVFSVVGLSIASLGVIPMAANSIAGNVNWATYVIPMALGSAASIRVGFYVGARDYDKAGFVARTAFIVSLVYALVVSALLVGGRHQIAALYTTEAPVLELAASLIIFIALYQIVDDTQATMGGVLRGYKDTRAPMIYTLVGFWFLALPLGAGLCFGWFGREPMGVSGYWIGMTLGLAVVAACMGLRLISTSRNPDRISSFAAI